MGEGKDSSSSSTSSSSPAVLLPQDVVIEVLARLPVKSLMRFKCASKSWHALIRHDPNFITKHFHHPSNTSTNVLLSHSVKYSLSFLSPDTLRVSVHDAPLPVQVTFLDPDYMILLPIYGPAKGLVCLSVNWELPEIISIYKGSLVLWNPSTRESKSVPILPFPDHLITTTETIVFGFDPTTDDCKIMRFATFLDFELSSWSRRAELYSLRSGSWRVIPTAGLRYFPHPSVIRELSCCVGGVAYLWASPAEADLPHSAQPLSELILSFHLADERFQEIPIPPQVKSLYLYIHLEDRNGSLLMVVLDEEGVHKSFDVWLHHTDADDNRVPNCNNSKATATASATWTRLYTIGPHPYLLRFLGFWKNDVVVVEAGDGGTESYLASYDIKTGQLACLRAPTSEYELFSFAILFCKGSLVPLRFSVNLEFCD